MRLAVIGGVFLAVSAFGAFQTWRLGECQEARGRLVEQVHRVSDINAENQRQITGLEDGLKACVTERQAQREASVRAIAESRAERDRIEGELERTRGELESIYEGDCQVWADTTACPAVADRLRQ